MIIKSNFITIDNDMWDDLGKKYFVHEAIYRKDTTAVYLVLEYLDIITKRVVAQNQIFKVN